MGGPQIISAARRDDELSPFSVNGRGFVHNLRDEVQRISNLKLRGKDRPVLFYDDLKIAGDQHEDRFESPPAKPCALRHYNANFIATLAE